MTLGDLSSQHVLETSLCHWVGIPHHRYIVALGGSKPRSRRAYATTSTRYQNERRL
jgi:hypothetical protein